MVFSVALRQVQRLLAQRLRISPHMGAIIDELVSHGSFLRDLRNYGVHPRGERSDDLEALFTEEACGLLIMSTRRYLLRLQEAVQRALAPPQGEDDRPS